MGTVSTSQLESIIADNFSWRTELSHSISLIRNQVYSAGQYQCSRSPIFGSGEYQAICRRAQNPEFLFMLWSLRLLVS